MPFGVGEGGIGEEPGGRRSPTDTRALYLLELYLQSGVRRYAIREVQSSGMPLAQEETCPPRDSDLTEGTGSTEIPVTVIPVTCVYTLTNSTGGSPSVSYPADAGTDFFNVTATDPTCYWTAISSASWLTITSASSTVSGAVTTTTAPFSGNGTGIVNFKMSFNNSATDRTATINVQDKKFIVTQAAGCHFNLAPA